MANNTNTGNELELLAQRLSRVMPDDLQFLLSDKSQDFLVYVAAQTNGKKNRSLPYKDAQKKFLEMSFPKRDYGKTLELYKSTGILHYERQNDKLYVTELGNTFLNYAKEYASKSQREY